jgi:hypothetical protein
MAKNAFAKTGHRQVYPSAHRRHRDEIGGRNGTQKRWRLSPQRTR